MFKTDFFDLHCDTPFECFTKSQKFYVNRLAVSGKKGETFNNWCQTFAFWIRDDLASPFEKYKETYADFALKLAEKPRNLTPYFAVEGGALLENDADRIFKLKSDGIIFLTLTWNGENNLAGGVKSDKTLTDFGKKAIKNLNRCKIGCDLSHLNQKSFFKAAEISDFPLATHSNCRSLCDNPRNLSDEQIKILHQKGGIMGLCFYPEFLGDDVFESIYRNIFYLCEKGYEDIIAIGSDFDGARMSPKLDNISKVKDLYSFLEGKGFKSELLHSIFYLNAYNFVAKLC